VPHCALPSRGLQLADVKDSQGLTPLHMAASNSAPEVAACIIPLLLDHGANVHAEHDSSHLGRVQPMHCAAANECKRQGQGRHGSFWRLGLM
jgi:ankyrin repeat protein